MPTIRVRPRHPITGSPITGEPGRVFCRYLQITFGADHATITRSSALFPNAQGFCDFVLDGSDETNPVNVQVAFKWNGVAEPGLLATVPSTEGPHVDGGIHYWELEEVLDDGQLAPVPVVAGVQSVTGDGVDNTDPRNPVITQTGGGGDVSSVAGVPPVGGDIPEADLAAALAGDFATTAQGALADTAVQPGDLATVATSGDYDDLTDKPTIPTTLPPTGTAGGVLSGTYPNPGFAVDMATQAELDAEVTARGNADALLAPKASPTFTGTVTVPTPSNATDAANKAYVDNAVIGLLDYRGSYAASANVFPSTGGSGAAGAVLKGDFWVASNNGTLGGVAVTTADLIIALADAPGQTVGNWDLIPHDGSFVALTGNQTVAGTKTFTSSVVMPTPTAGDNSTKGATTAYVDNGDAAAVPKALVDAKGDLLVATADNTVTRLPVGSNTQVLTADSTQTSGVKWAAAAGGGGTPTFAANSYLGPPMVSIAGTASQGTNFMRAIPLDLPIAVTCIALGIGVTSGTATSLCRLGIYSDVAGLPGTLLVDAGTVNCATTGDKEASVSSLALPAGRVWLVGCAQTAAVTAYTMQGAVSMINNSGATFADGGLYYPGYYNTAGGITGALPGTFGGVSQNVMSGLFRIYMKVA